MVRMSHYVRFLFEYVIQDPSLIHFLVSRVPCIRKGAPKAAWRIHRNFTHSKRKDDVILPARLSEIRLHLRCASSADYRSTWARNASVWPADGWFPLCCRTKPSACAEVWLLGGAVGTPSTRGKLWTRSIRIYVQVFISLCVNYIVKKMNLGIFRNCFSVIVRGKCV